MAGIVLHSLHFGRGAKRVRNALGRSLVVGGEADAHMAVIEDRVVRTVSFLDLVQRLRDEERLQTVACHEGERALEKVQAPKGGKFVEHEQQPVSIALRLQVLGEATADLIEDQADQRLGPVDVRWRHHEVKCGWMLAANHVGDTPVAATGDLGHDGIAIQAEERHRCRQHPGALVIGLVEQFAGGAGDHRMWTGLAEMGGLHHRREGRLDRALRIGEKGGDAGQCLVGLCVQDMQDRADQKRVRCLLPVVSLFERAFRVDENVGDVLHVADFPFAAAHFEQRVVGRRLRVRRIEEQHAAMPCAIAGGERPVLALDVVDDRRPRPRQERRHHQANALAGTGRREAQHMLRTVMAEILALMPAEYDSVGAEQSCRLHLFRSCPAGRAIGLDVLGFTRPPYRHADRDGDGDEATRRGDVGALDEDRRRIGVVEIPPPEEGRGIIDRPSGQFEPRLTELGLEAETVGCPLRGAPGRHQHDQENGEDLPPEDFRRRHGRYSFLGGATCRGRDCGRSSSRRRRPRARPRRRAGRVDVRGTATRARAGSRARRRSWRSGRRRARSAGDRCPPHTRPFRPSRMAGRSRPRASPRALRPRAGAKFRSAPARS